MEPISEKDEFKATIETVRGLLRDNPEWVKRYAEYAKKLSTKTYSISSEGKKFREWSPLYFYMNITNAKDSSESIKLDIRYLGQSIADLKCNNKVTLDTSKYDESNKRDFDCEISLSKVAWDGGHAKEFRNYFKKNIARKTDSNKKSNEEHRLESLLITEFLKPKEKNLSNIKAVTIGNYRFPMKTPISASNHGDIKYSANMGGGIDILARTGIGGETSLCIIEVKDENNTIEPPKDALKQAIAYATFIRELLRSDEGEKWWKLFGFRRQLPKKLVLHAVCAMPLIENSDKSFESSKIDIDGDIMKLHYLYFSETNNIITKIDSSLNKNVIKKS